MNTTKTPPRSSGSATRPLVLEGADRFAGRKAAERRRRWRRRSLMVCLLAVFAGSAWVLGWSEVLGVRTIEVIGEQRAPANLVVLTADVDPGTPLARIDPDQIAAKVAGLKVVAEVSVERAWPNTLRITVKERTAVTVGRRGESLRLVDSNGVDFATAKAAPRAIPMLDLDLDVAAPPDVEAGLAVIQGMPRALARQVATVEVRSPQDVRLTLGSGAVVLWGDSSDPQRKAEVLTALLAQRAQRYDVRAPDAPTTFG